MILTPEKFVEVWQKAECVNDVCKVFRIATNTAIMRAGNYRKHGVPLKRFRHSHGRLNYENLKRIAKKSA